MHQRWKRKILSAGHASTVAGYRHCRLKTKKNRLDRWEDLGQSRGAFPLKVGGCPVQWGHSAGQIEVVNLAMSEGNAYVLQACVWERLLGSYSAVHVSSWEYRFVAVEAQVASCAESPAKGDF
jgi:hypothetical protein